MKTSKRKLRAGDQWITDTSGRVTGILPYGTGEVTEVGNVLGEVDPVTGGIEFSIAGATAGQEVVNRHIGRAALTSNISHSGVGTLSSFTGAFKGNTAYQETLMLPCGVDSIQIALLSDVADVSTYTGVQVFVQTTDLSGAGSDLKNPYFNSAVQNMQAVTFAGASNPVFSAGNAQAPTPIWSDWIPVVNTGVNAPTYLIVRVWYPATVANGGGYFAVDAQSGRAAKLRLLGANGDYFYAGTPIAGNNNAAMIASTFYMPTLVRFATTKRVVSIAQYGDSTRQGWYADGVIAAVERYAIKRSLAGKPTSVTNRGVTGQTGAQYLARLKADVAAGERFDVLIWQVASPNDGWSAVITQQQLNNAHAAIRIAESIGAHIILDGPFPMVAGAPSGAQLASILAANSFCVAMNGIRPGISACFYAGLHDPGNFGKWVAALNNAGDGLHQNELATTSVILPQITAAIDAAIF